MLPAYFRHTTKRYSHRAAPACNATKTTRRRSLLSRQTPRPRRPRTFVSARNKATVKQRVAGRRPVRSTNDHAAAELDTLQTLAGRRARDDPNGTTPPAAALFVALPRSTPSPRALPPCTPCARSLCRFRCTQCQRSSGRPPPACSTLVPVLDFATPVVSSLRSLQSFGTLRVTPSLFRST